MEENMMYLNRIDMARTGDTISKEMIVDMPVTNITGIVPMEEDTLRIKGVTYVDAGDDWIHPFLFEIEVRFLFKDMVTERDPKELYRFFKEHNFEKTMSIVKIVGGMIINNPIHNKGEKEE